MMRARIAVALAAAFVVAGSLVPPASADEGPDVIAASVPPGSQVSDEGHWYRLDARPGSAVTQSVRITNTNTHQVRVAVEAVDAGTSPNTGTALGAPGSPKALTSRWIAVSSPEITLAPGQQRDIPFTVRVPSGTAAGQYLAAVSASVPKDVNAKPAQPAGNKAAFAISLRFQRVIAVEVVVAGPRAPQLVVTGAEPKATADGVTLGVHIANNGNAFAHGHGVVRVASTNTDLSFPIDTFISHTAIVFPAKWTDRIVPGTHHVQVDLDYEGGRRTSWNGDIAIAGDTLARLQNDLRNLQTGTRESPNWALIVAIGLAVLFVGGALTLRRRSRRRPAVKYRAA